MSFYKGHSGLCTNVVMLQVLTQLLWHGEREARSEEDDRYVCGTHTTILGHEKALRCLNYFAGSVGIQHLLAIGGGHGSV